MERVTAASSIPFGEGYGLTSESEEDVGTEVTIRLPYRNGKETAMPADITGR